MIETDAECDAAGQRTCPTCRVVKLLSEFNKRDRRYSKYGCCKACHSAKCKARYATNRSAAIAYQQTWYAANRERSSATAQAWKKAHPERTRNTYLLFYYDMTVEQFWALLAQQHNTCPGCAKLFSPALKPVVDHDHVTGGVRGLLCGHCNRALGLAKDNSETLEKLERYLLEYTERG